MTNENVIPNNFLFNSPFYSVLNSSEKNSEITSVNKKREFLPMTDIVKINEHIKNVILPYILINANTNIVINECTKKLNETDLYMLVSPKISLLSFGFENIQNIMPEINCFDPKCIVLTYVLKSLKGYTSDFEFLLQSQNYSVRDKTNATFCDGTMEINILCKNDTFICKSIVIDIGKFNCKFPSMYEPITRWLSALCLYIKTQLNDKLSDYLTDVIILHKMDKIQIE